MYFLIIICINCLNISVFRYFIVKISDTPIVQNRKCFKTRSRWSIRNSSLT